MRRLIQRCIIQGDGGGGGVSEHTCTCTSLEQITTLNFDGLNNNTSLIVWNFYSGRYFCLNPLNFDVFVYPSFKDSYRKLRDARNTEDQWMFLPSPPLKSSVNDLYQRYIFKTNVYNIGLQPRNSARDGCCVMVGFFLNYTFSATLHVFAIDSLSPKPRAAKTISVCPYPDNEWWPQDNLYDTAIQTN